MNLASPVQLDIIDRLRGLGISNFVALPQVREIYLAYNSLLILKIEQLAVVGDQSRYDCPIISYSSSSMLIVVVARAPSLKASLSSRFHETAGYVPGSRLRLSSDAVQRVPPKSPSSRDPIAASKKRTNSVTM
jgi:hypothetical protein